MKIQLIRNATMKISYAGKTILTDPMLSPKGAIRSFAGIAKNPTVELPMTVGEILTGVEAVLVSHTHPDHFDEAGALALPKEIPVFCQPGDELTITESGLPNVTPIATTLTWNHITITRTGGRHGRGEILQMMGNVSGFVLQAREEPTVYWAGDSIWCDEVAETITRFAPDIIITHSGGATIPGHEPIVMDGGDTLKVLASSGDAIVVAVHMEALDHCPVRRKALREMAVDTAIPPSRLMIPADGEVVVF